MALIDKLGEQKKMTPRERILTALNREVPDRVPKDALFTPSVLKTFQEKTGANDPEKYFGMELRRIRVRPTRKKVDFTPYLSEFPPGTIIDEWGVGHAPGSLHHFTRGIHPMAAFNSIEDIENYPFPDLGSSYRYDGLEMRVASLKSKELATAGWAVTSYAWARWLRGEENILTDMLLNEDFIAALLDRTTEIGCSMARQFARTGVDIIVFGDDMGGQNGLLMSPSLWRKLLKPRLAMTIRSALEINPKVHIFYHSDGDIEEIIPDLIEIGVDVLNPIQPECMDPAAIKKKYGDRLALWGTIGIQHTMPFGTPEDVKQEVKERIATAGRGGGFVIAPSHEFEPEVPWENILAFFQAVEEYGKYD